MKRLAVALSFLAGFLVALQPSGSFAQTKKFQSSNWVTACQKNLSGRGRTCRMSRAIRQIGNNKPLLVTAIQRDLKNRGYMLVLRLPHGLNLPLGVQLQIDRQKARRIAVLSSNRGGTYTRINLSDKVLATLKRGRQLSISFVTVDGKRFAIPVSLSGFTASFNRLKKMR
ncbi:MAG TPA: invasion associated locus B family protein [Rhizobiales bacterium]|nr:invasion associated locus B family protein [Hyphomicrobiales bacterium]